MFELREYLLGESRNGEKLSTFTGLKKKDFDFSETFTVPTHFLTSNGLRTGDFRIDL